MIKLSIPNLHCGGCAETVTKALIGVDPKAVVEMDLADKSASVTSDNDVQGFLAALDKAGYPATAA